MLMVGLMGLIIGRITVAEAPPGAKLLGWIAAAWTLGLLIGVVVALWA
jgi:hypothetical protein